MLGLLHSSEGRPAAAVPLLALAARLRPDRAVAHEALGNALHRLGRAGEAEAAWRRALELRPDHRRLTRELADLLRAQGRHDEATTLLRQALDAGADDPALRLRLAEASLSAGSFEAAQAAARQIPDGVPEKVGALRVEGDALLRLDRAAEALATFRRLVDLAPGRWDGPNGLGLALNRLGRWDAAVPEFERAAALAPARPEPLVNLSSALDRQGRLDEAVAAARAALDRDPDLAEAHFNLGVALAGLGRDAEAVVAYDRAVDLRPDEAEFRFNRSHCHLALGDLESGWADFAFLWSERRMRRRPYPQPLWDGGPVAGRVVVWGEQGIGDEVLAAGLLGDLAAASRGVVVECDPRLVPLLGRSHPDLTIVPRRPEADPAGLAPDVVCQAPMVYLPMYLRRSWDRFPDHAGYLTADPERVASLRRRYGGPRAGRIVGISWHSANRSLGRHKSLDLADWAPILSVPGITFVSLQYGPVDAAAGTPVRVDPEIDPLLDVDGFAAQVAAMDLVVTVSNSTAHFAGALGRPCWLMLPRTRGLLWYWLMGRGDRNPWYPSIRVFRQQSQGEWAEVIARVAAAIRDG